VRSGSTVSGDSHRGIMTSKYAHNTHSRPHINLRQNWTEVFSPAILSEHIHPSSEIQTGQSIVLAARVSSWEQAKSGNLEDSLEVLREESCLRKCNVVGEYKYVGTGKYPNLAPAVEMVLKHNAGILFESVDRIIRPISFHHTKNINAPLLVHDFERLYKETGDIKLYVIGNPDAPMKDVRSSQTKRGLQKKKVESFRTLSPERRAECIKFILQVHNELRRSKLGSRTISKRVLEQLNISINYTTILDITKQY
jgi:hypothetical protein